MAPGLGPFVRMLAQAAVPLFRAFATAYQQALHNARKEGATAAKEALKPKRGAMTPAEAAEILHLPEGGAADAAQVAARYDKLYAMNDPSKGGSFYLQSKILRARGARRRDRRRRRLVPRHCCLNCSCSPSRGRGYAGERRVDGVERGYKCWRSHIPP